MAITYPRALPSMRFAPGSRIKLERQDTRSPSRGGLIQVAEVGAPLWFVQYRTPPMAEAKGLAFEAWLDSLRGGGRYFQAVHPFRRTAIAYPGGYGGMTKHTGGSFTGAGVLQAVGVTLDTATISGLPSTFKLTEGDLLSFVPTGSRQAFHRVIEGATASAGVATVTVEPTIKPGYTLNAAVALGSPWFKAVLERESVQIDWQFGRHCTVSFDAWQTLI